MNSIIESVSIVLSIVILCLSIYIFFYGAKIQVGLKDNQKILSIQVNGIHNKDKKWTFHN